MSLRAMISRLPLISELVREGIAVSHSADPSDLPEWAQTMDPDHLTVVWTPAIPQKFKLFQVFAEHGIQMVKRSEVLGQLTSDLPTLAVAGTHGKTTTSTWLAHIMTLTQQGCHAFLGGIDSKSGSNFLSQPNAIWHVLEADEFDRSFHHLHPTCAAITNIDPDHLDIYGSEKAFHQAFVTFGTQVQRTLILPYGVAWPESQFPKLERFAVIHSDEEIPAGATHAAVVSGGQGAVTFYLGMSGIPASAAVTFEAHPSVPGLHNTANALVAVALAMHAGVDKEALKTGIETFQGVHRRLDVHLDTSAAVYVDDYAHHPSELSALIQTVKSEWPGRPVSIVFQPHLYSRTQDFLEEFAQALALADQIFLLPIYPAREEPIPGVDAQLLFDNISGTAKHLSTSESIFGDLKACSVDVLVTAGAGDIDRLVPKFLEHMQDRLI